MPTRIAVLLLAILCTARLPAQATPAPASTGQQRVRGVVLI